MPTFGDIINEIQEKSDTQESAFDQVRAKYLNRVSDETGRGVILYSSGWTELDVNSPQFSISDTDVQGFMETISTLDSDELDLLLHSPGGSTEVAEQIVNYLREKFDSLRIFVPQAALSAATLMCCAADEVIMGYHSSLGPTDPQMLIPTKTGQRWVPAQTIVDQFDEIDEKIQQGEEIAHYTPILNQYDPGLKQEAQNAISLTNELAERWAEVYMFDGDPQASSKATDVSEYLSDHTNFLSHNRRLSRDNIESETPMNVTELEQNQNLQDAVLSTFHAVTATHGHQGFTKIIENNNRDRYVRRLQE
jgi:ATP-dependent protease ClpP protease subunit